MSSTSRQPKSQASMGSPNRGLSERLPPDVLIHIFHHVNVRDVYRCQRLCKFFFKFLRHNFDAIDPQKITDTDVEVVIGFATGGGGRIHFETTRQYEQKPIHCWLLGIDSSKNVKNEKQLDVIQSDLIDVQFVRDHSSTNKWRLATLKENPIEVVQTFARIIAKHYEIVSIGFGGGDDSKSGLVNLLSHFPSATSLRIGYSIYCMRHFVDLVARTSIKKLKFFHQRGETPDWEYLLSHPYCQNLESLSIQGGLSVPQLTDASLKKLNCRRITVSVDNSVTFLGIRQLIKEWIAGLHPLEHLSIDIRARDLNECVPVNHVCLPKSGCGQTCDGLKCHKFRRATDNAVIVLKFDAENRWRKEVTLCRVRSEEDELTDC